MEKYIQIHKGLDGIYVDESSICYVNGETGQLKYRDFPIEELASKSMESVIFLLLKGTLPSQTQEAALYEFLSLNCSLDANELNLIKNLNRELHPMQVLQLMVLALNKEPKKPELLQDDFADSQIINLAMAAKLSSVVTSFYRLSLGLELFKPKPNWSLLQNFLFQFHGKAPSDIQVKTLNKTQILQMEHGFNASTFSARVTKSTLAPDSSAISAAIGTLFGSLHGGADEASLKMVMQINSLDTVETFIQDKLAKKEKIMGMGHRVYRVVDPRAQILKPMAEKLCLDTPFEELFRKFEAVEQTMENEMAKKGKRIKANVEFYKAPVFYALGIPSQYFTPLFALGRVYGWIAHLQEASKNNRLIRPKAMYKKASKVI